MRYFLEIVRAVFLKGVGLDVLWPKFVMLFVLGATILGVNSVRFHKRLE
jgi:ABC-2 type transport system permease protein